MYIYIYIYNIYASLAATTRIPLCLLDRSHSRVYSFSRASYAYNPLLYVCMS